MALDIPRNKELFKQRDVRETTGRNAVFTFNTTYNYSAPGLAFVTSTFGKSIDYGQEGAVAANTDDVLMQAPLYLPQGATIKSVIVTGNAGATAETWNLRRITTATGADVIMATALIGTASSNISNPIITNQTYDYTMEVDSLDTGDVVIGLTISYQFN